MKRTLLIVMLVCALICAACGGQNSSGPTPEPVQTAEPDPIAEEELTLVTPEPTPTPVPPTPMPEPTPTPEPTPEPTPSPTPEPEGLIGWSVGGFVPREEQVRNETEYIGENLHFTVSTVTDNDLFRHKLTYYVVDIYLRDIRCLRTAAAKDFQSKNRDTISKIAERSDALAAISGDMFNHHKNQLVIRNGEIYDTGTYDNFEVCFLYTDGTMETMTVDAYKANGPSKEVWQAWEFGPSLLDEEGHALQKTNSKVKPLNPRCAIGYYEPGHYCFVTVDGRQKHSDGLEMKELSVLMEMLGCKIAFNLDGGESASLYWNGGVFSKPCNGGRDIADIVYLIDYQDADPSL
jgi:exopolysaccharide biosynthesis protein